MQPGRLLIALVLAPVVLAQSDGIVRYTEVVDHPVRRTIQLPGTVESRRTSIVAGEVAGLVVELTAQPGHAVVAGEPLARLRRDYVELQLQAAEGRSKEARARLQLAESKLARARDLFDEQVVSQQALDDAFSEFTAWQGRLDQATAEIGTIELALDRSVVRAPFTGVVVAKRTEVGQWIERGGEVVEMIALDDLQVQVDVPERYYGQLIPGASIDVAFEALPDYAITGELVEIIPRADPQARSFPAKVRLPNPDGRVGVGMLARLSLPVGDTFRAVLVPKDSVVRQGAGESVFRINGDGVVEPVSVETGQGVGSWVVVRSSLVPGEKVVTRGNERLQPGQPVHGELLEYALP